MFSTNICFIMKYFLKNKLLPNGEVLELESAKVSDAQSLWNFGYALSLDHEFQASYPDEFFIKPEEEPKFIKDCQEHPCKLALVARSRSGEVVAMCNIMPTSRFRKSAHVVALSMGILSQYRDKKLGQILLQETIETIKTNSAIEKIELRVLSSNARAIALYKKFKFQEVGRLKREFKFALDDYRDDLFMELMLR